MTNQIEYTGFRQDSYLKFTCRLFFFFRKGSALMVINFGHTPYYVTFRFNEGSYMASMLASFLPGQ